VGIFLNAVIGLLSGKFGWLGFLQSAGEGVASMGDLIIVTMLAGGMLEIIRVNGGIDWIINVLTRRISGRRGAESTIALLVALANVCTANNTIAIITTGSIAREIAGHFGVDPRKSASILDTFSCIVQGILPYGAQLLMASGLAGISVASIIGCLYYPLALLVFALLAIWLRFPRI
jgi:Na+/H+ antiporter NhaC